MEMQQVVLFKNNNENYALDITYIEKIIEYKEAKKIPESLEFLIGIISYNDKILPIVDLNVRLFKQKNKINKEGKILIINCNDTSLGLLVDDVLGINTLNKGELEKSSNNNYGISKDYIEGFITEDKKEIIIVLNPTYLFSQNQKQQIENIIEQN